MQVNSINNFKMTQFGNEKPEVNKVEADQKSETELKAQLKEDKFQQATPPKNDMMSGFTIPTVAQVSKMQTVQKVIGGAVAALGALGMASAFSSKKWVRAIFTIPVGGFITLFGVNMFRMAGALDRLKAVASSNSQGSQQ